MQGNALGMYKPLNNYIPTYRIDSKKSPERIFHKSGWALICYNIFARINQKNYDFGHFEANSKSYWTQYVSFNEQIWVDIWLFYGL